MYYQIKGVARYKGYLVNRNDAPFSNTFLVDSIAMETNPQHAAYKVLSRAVLDNARSLDCVPTEQEWEHAPEITIVPPDIVNRMIGPEIAPTLPGLE